MELQTTSDHSTLGDVLMLARRRRGLTQEELGKDSGIGQAAIAKLERNRTIPKVTTLCRYLRALSLTPEEELDVWYKIRGNVKEIDWSERLGITDFELARDRARQKLNGGDIYDAYGYIEAMHQLAVTDEDKAWAQMLHANRFKDLGLFALAEQYYNRATVTLGSSGNPRTISRILLNLADLHVEQGRHPLADAYVTYALQRELDPSSRAYAFLVKGRVAAARGGAQDLEEALQWYEKANEGYASLKSAELRDVGQAWARLGRGAALSTSADPSRARDGMRELKGLVSTFGPSDHPVNPELYTRAIVALAERTGDDMSLNNAYRLAKKHGFRTVMERVKALRGGVMMALMLVAALLATATPGTSYARPGEDACREGRGAASQLPRERREEPVRASSDRLHDPDEVVVWVYDIVNLFEMPWSVFAFESAARGEGEDPGFSDNGPEE